MTEKLKAFVDLQKKKKGKNYHSETINEKTQQKFMEAKQFRLGNLVYKIGLDYVHDVPIPDYSDKEIAVVDLEILENILNFDHTTDFELYEPIPITEEWHIKLGALKKGYKTFEYKFPKNPIKILFSGDYVMLVKHTGSPSIKDSIITIWDKEINGRGMYIHELQNFFNSLTETELTLK